MTSLRTVVEDLKNEHIQYEYQTSFISEKYRNCGLSPNTISVFLDKIGKATTIIERFMNYRLNKFSNNPIVIDGMLKSNTSTTNIFSEFSRKSKIKGSTDLNLIYAYDIKNEEPLLVLFILEICLITLLLAIFCALLKLKMVFW